MDNGKDISLDFIKPTLDPNFVVIQYHMGDSVHFTVWDMIKDQEHLNTHGDFLTYQDHFMGARSKFGYAGFNQYIINLDTGVINPFMKKEERLNYSTQL